MQAKPERRTVIGDELPVHFAFTFSALLKIPDYDIACVALQGAALRKMVLYQSLRLRHAISRFVNSVWSALANEIGRFTIFRWTMRPPSPYLQNTRTHNDCAKQEESECLNALDQRIRSVNSVLTLASSAAGLRWLQGEPWPGKDFRRLRVQFDEHGAKTG